MSETLPNFWNFPFPFQGSASNTQSILPGFMAPSYTFNIAGDEKLEARIVSDVASYGTQLDKVMEAVLELAGVTDTKGKKIEALITLFQSVQATKSTDTQLRLQHAEEALSALKQADEKKYKDRIAKRAAKIPNETAT